ncbi:ATP-NAD kinase-like protein [Leptomonas pyrrhocoris]|uniref:ATP-NAD kinase-like protein n=1 Tax=Leptomonas pyrrhocoris TaxID=157538 RepID=A0A0M9G710_LEPPY|nr:ATP-NAD kinase-like protein [Leptomonas pyrrhocoris]KPA83639.1 ATP-NAD kinase-like protein [Leptomonas pyrrhocoris]|eukprot:XP_015662078.1 ATP-NAD kinase-like protein [Leptomonas pyrrhocoris]
MQRTVAVLCGGGPYHVPTLARVALFPIHLDPPTRQHRELFRLLLGAPDLATLSQPPPLAAVATPAMSMAPPSSSGTARTSQSASAGSPVSAAAGLKGKLQSFMQRQKGVGEGGPSIGGSSTPSSSGAVAPAANFLDADPIFCGSSSPFWYMEAFATSLREDSQLAPFDDIILIPNTRGPVSLRQSTHLAALAVLATRGLAHVHVDFTALEHPDESMPIIYELVCKYTNCVLMHWLQDAYEMQNWSHFAEFKNTVPMLLLQTQSYPPRALERQRPLGSVSRLPSRQYHSPPSPYVRSPAEAAYYRSAEQFMHASMMMRRRNPSPMALVGGGDYVDTDMRERYESASLVNRETDYFDDVPDGPPNHRRAEEMAVVSSSSSTGAAAWRGEESEAARGTPPPTAHERAFVRSPLLRGGQTTTRTASTTTPGGPNRSSGGSSSSSTVVPRSASTGRDRLGLSYADCAKGRWWNTPGGRGDDEVELSRAYWSSTSSSWLGGGGTGATSSLPDWMEEVGATAKANTRNHRRTTEHHASSTQISDPALAEEADENVRGGGAAATAAAAPPNGERDAQGLDTVVSDDGFALAVEEQHGEHVDVGDDAGTTSERDNEASPQVMSSLSSESVARESADEDTRKRYLTREIEDVRKMLDGMLRLSGVASAASSSSATAAAAAAAGAASENAKSMPLSSQGGAATSSSSNSTVSGALSKFGPARAPGRDFGLYEAHHHDAHGHNRRRHRSVRQLIEELFPPRVYGQPATAAAAGPTAIGAVEDGIREYYGGNHAAAAAAAASGSGSGRLSRAVSSASIFNTAVKITPTHLERTQQGGLNRSSRSDGDASKSKRDEEGSRISTIPSSVTDGDVYSWIDSPLVEVHPITRSTGADVRQALWEQEIHPSSILTDCVQRYMEGHGLYRDPRKATAASLYAGVGANDFSGSARSGGGVGGPGGQLGAAAEVSGGFRDPATAGSGSAGSSGGGGVGVSSSAVGNTIMDGRTGVRRVAPRDTSTLFFPGLIPRLELHYDRNNLLAREQFEKLRLFQCQDGEEPDLIVPIGGDGYMMHCIRKNWRRFIPFYGVNAGHVGYLLNDRSTLEELFSSPLKLHFTTMLYCQAEKEGDTGERMLLSELAFNDAWVERSSGQTALIRILVNGQERIRRLRGDGVLVSTAAGSTAYSQALGASPVPVGAPLIQVVGSNVVSPAQWRPAHLDQEDQVEFEVIDSTKRPCRCYVDSVDVGNVTRLLVRSSRVAGVTLAFSKSCDLQHKLYHMQFPKTL